MSTDLRTELIDNLAVLIVLSKEQFLPRLNDVVKELNGISQKNIYIALTQPYKTAILNFQKNGLSLDKNTFIDVLTSTVENPIPDQNCIYVSSPSALTELSVAFSKVVTDKKCDSAVFDSISTLLIYEESNAVIRFVHNILTKSRVLKTKTVFVCLKEDKDVALIKELYMLVDKVVDLTSAEERIADILKR